MKYQSFSSPQKLFLAGVLSFIFINFAQAQVPLYGTITGGNTINVTVPGNYGGTYYTGHSFIFLAVGSVTSGPVTISVNGAAPQGLKKNVSQNLVAGDIVDKQAVPVIYDGTNFQIVNGENFVSSTASSISTLNGLTTTSQNFSTTSTGTSVNINSSGSTHNFNIPLVTVVGGNNVTVSGGFPNYTISGLAGGTSTSQWVSTTNGIYYSGGNIGLKINPQYDLHLYNPTAGVYSRFETPITTTTFNVLEFKTGIYNSTTLRSNAIWQLGMYQAGTASNPNDKMYFGRSGLSSTDLAVYRDGNVGIGLPGASVPSEKLTVLGNISASGIAYSQSINVSQTLNQASFFATDAVGSAQNYLEFSTGRYNSNNNRTDARWQIGLNQDPTPSDNDFWGVGRNNIGYDFKINRNGFVGIGPPTFYPQVMLDVAGNTRIGGVLTITSFAGNGTQAVGVNNLGQLVTIAGASSAITSINTLTTTSQTFSTSSTGSSININSSGSVHNFNIPVVTVVGGNNVTVSGGFPNYTITGKPNTPSNWTDSGIDTYHNTGGKVGINASGTLNARFVVGGNNASNQTSGAEEVVQIGSNESGSPLLRLGVLMQVDNLPQNRYMALNSTNSLLLQANSGNVGIGSALPNEKLTVQGNTSVTGIGYFGSLQVKNLIGPGTVTVDGLGNLGVSTGSSNLTNFWTITGGTLFPAIASNRINISTATGGYQINGTDVVTFETNTVAGNSIYLGGAGKLGSTGGNVAIGNLSGINNTGTNNVFVGLRAGNANTSGNYNSFVGAFSGYNLQNTNFNSFFGYGAGVASNTGADNTFIGGYAGQTNTSGSGNIALGVQADFTSNNLFNAVAIGYRSTVGGSNMMALGGTGAQALSVGIGTGLPQNTIDVVGGARIRNLSVSGAVFANASGDLYISTTSSTNFWTISGTNLAPTSTYGVNLTSTTTSYMIGGVDVVRYMPRGGGVGNNILLGGAGNQSMTGDGNVLIGDQAGVSNTSGSYNSFVGYGAGMSNTNGAQNTFIGRTAGRNNTSGGSNTLIGNYAGWSNVSGSGNTYNGWSAGTNNLGSGNSYFGFYSGINSTAGSDNSIFGYFADIPGSSVRSVAIGAYATVLGSNMMALGGVAGSPYAVSVGIGTGLPQNTIDVVGGARIRNLSVSGAVFANSSGDLYISSTAGLSGSGTANGVTFWRNGTTLTADGANFTYTSSTKSLKVGNAILSSNSSSGNVFFGTNVGNQTMSGTDNNFFGTNIGQIVTSGKNNNFFGKGAGSNNVLGESNNYLGEDAGSLNQIGSYNNAMGYQAGYGNISGIGSNNNSFGQGTGFENEGDGNNFMGFFAGRGNTSGNYNNFFGQSAGLVNTTGSDNIFIGQESGLNNSTGDNNIAIGKYAGFPVNGFSNSVAIGYNATVGGSNLMAFGGSGANAVSVGIGTGLPQNTLDVVGGARIRNLSVSGAVFANASGDLYISTSTGTNYWTITGSNLQPLSNTNSINISSETGFYKIAGNSALGMLFTTTLGLGNSILIGGGGNPLSTGGGNISIGDLAGIANTTGNQSVFIGYLSGNMNNSGLYNTMTGAYSGYQNQTGNLNSFYGYNAGGSTNAGGGNTFIGGNAGFTNATGGFNVALGFNADFSANNLTNAIAIGYGATVGGSNRMALGGTGANAVSVGIGTGLPQNTIDVVGGARIRNLSVSGAVFANASGDLYINTASSINLWTVSGTSLTPSTSSYGLNIGTNITTPGLVNISNTTNSGLVVSVANLPTNTGAIMAYSYSSSSAGIGAFVYNTSATALYGEATNALSTGVTANNSGGGTALRVTANGSSAPVAQINNNGLTGTALNINLTSGVNSATGLLINTPSPTSQAMDITGKVQLRNYTNGTLTVDGLGNLGVTTVTSNVGPGSGFLSLSTTIQSIPAASWNTIQFQAEQFDDATAYDNSVTYDYTAPSSGVYQVNASVPFANIGQVDIAITIGGSNNIIVNSVSTSPTTGVITSVPVSGIIKLTANQKVTIRVRQFTGQTQNTASSASGANASFSMVKLY